MKKLLNLKKLVFLTIVILSVITGSTCKNAALGSAVDINRPEITVTSPYMKAIVRNSFTLKGSVKDDGKIESVAVTLKHKTVNKSAGPFYATVDGDKWTLVLNRKKDGKFPIIDGDYEIYIATQDASGKVSKITHFITIDNTPPILIINRPSTIAKDGKLEVSGKAIDADKYGAELWIKGECSDSAGVKHINVYAFDDKSTFKKIASSENVPPTVQLKVGEFNNNKVAEGFYNSLYGGTAVGLKKFKCGMEIWDNAKEFDSPDSDKHPDRGNVSYDYYLYAPLYNNIVFPNYSATDLYNMMTGLAELDGATGQRNASTASEVEKILKGLKSGSFPNTGIFKVSLPLDSKNDVATGKIAGKNIGVFGLNPALNPRFEIMGTDPVNTDDDDPDTTSPGHPDPNYACKNVEQSQGSIITVKIAPNLDEVPIEKTAFKFYFTTFENYKSPAFTNFDINNESNLNTQLAKTDASGNHVFFEVTPNSPSDVKPSGPNWNASLKLDKAHFKPKSAYVLLIAGTDKQGNSFIADTKGKTGAYKYAFYIPAIGKAPTLRAYKINDKGSSQSSVTDAKAAHEVSSTAYITKDGDLNFDCYVDSVGGYPVTLSWELQSDGSTINTTKGSTSITSESKYEGTITNANLPAITSNKEYKLLLTAKVDATSVSTTKSYTVYHDVTAPSISLTGLADGQYITKDKLNIKGSISDQGKGYDKTATDATQVINVKIKTPTGAYSTAKPLTIDGSSWHLNSPISLSEEGEYKVKIKATDLCGNPDEKEHSFYYDKSKPELNIQINTSTESQIYSTDGNIHITGTATDGYKLDSLEIKVDNSVISCNNTTELTLSADEKTYTINKTISGKANGTYTVEINVTDKAGRDNFIERTVIVDKDKPTVTPKAALHNSWQKNKTVAVSGEASDTGEGLKVIQYTLGTVGTTSTWTPLSGKASWDGYITLEEGENTVTYKAIDEAGNESTQEEQTIKVDTNPPSLKLTSSSIGSIASGSIYVSGKEDLTLNYTSTDPSSGSGIKDNSVTIEIKGTTPKTYSDKNVASFTIPKTDLKTLGEKNTVLLTVKDKAGNVSVPAQFILQLDKAAPIIKMSSPKPDAKSDSSLAENDWASKEFLVANATITGSFSDAGSGISGDDSHYTCTIGKDNSPLLTKDVDTTKTVNDIFKKIGSNWMVSIEDIADYCKAKYANASDRYDIHGTQKNTGTIYRIPIHITAKDLAGNAKTETFYVMVDSDGKTPKYNILLPNQKLEGSEPPEKKYNGYKVITLGGNILFSGTCQTNNALAGKITKFEIRFSRYEGFAIPSTSPAGTKDYTLDGTALNTGVVAKDLKSGFNSWMYELDAFKLLKSIDASEAPLFYSVRFTNDDNTSSDWSPTRKIILDEKAPIFEKPATAPAKLIKAKIDKGSGTLSDYSSGSPVKDGDKLVCYLLAMEGISKIEVTSDTAGCTYLNSLSSLSGDAAIKAANIDGKVFATESEFTADSGKKYKGYKMTLPIKISTLTDAKQEFKIKVKITDNRSGDQVSNYKTFVLNYDKTKPVVIFGKPCAAFANDGVFTSTKATAIKAVKKNFDKYDKLAKKKALYVFVKTKDNRAKEIAVDSVSTADDGTINYASHPQGNIFESNSVYGLIEKNRIVFDNADNGYSLEGVAFDTGSGPGKVKAKLDSIEKETDKFSNLLDGFKSFSIDQIETTYVPEDTTTSPTTPAKGLVDGKNTLKLSVTDKAGNKTDFPASGDDVYLRNKPLSISKVSFATDLNGDGKFKTDSDIGLEEIVGVDGNKSNIDKSTHNYISKIDFVSAKTTGGKTNEYKDDFIIKNKNSSITFELSNCEATEQISYKLYKNSIADANKVAEAEPNAVANKIEIKLNSDNFGSGANELSEGENTLIVVLKDAEASADTDRKLMLTVKVNVSTTDSNKPQVAVLPFYWNSDEDNSLVSEKSTLAKGKESGHIEITKVSKLATLTGESDVSGIVVVRGFAFHTSKLTKLDYAGVTSTYSGGTWSNPGKLIVTDQALNSKGHWVSWEYIWDTPDVATTPKTLSITANDTTALAGSGSASPTKPISIVKGTATTGTTTSVFIDTDDVPSLILGGFITFSANEELYLRTVKAILPGTDNSEVMLNAAVPKKIENFTVYTHDENYKMNYIKTSRTANVVPYITGIETSKRTESGLNKNTIRSSSGKYSIMKGSTVDFITVKGFNLKNATARVVAGSVASPNNTDGIKLTINGSATKTGFTASNALSKSGYLEVFVSGVRAVNNMNVNTKPYNKEEDKYLLKNKTLNDDRYFRVFDMKKTDVKNGYYPEMIMDGNNPVFGYVDLSGGPNKYITLGGAGKYYPSHAMPQRAKFNTDGSTNDVEYLIKASIWDQMGMAKDDGGRYYHATTYDRDGAAMYILYHRYAELYSKGKGWGAGTGYQGYDGNWTYESSNNALGLERVDYGDGLLLGRYQYPKMIAKGNSVTGNATVYMAYYDAGTNDSQIIFRNFKLGTDSSLGYSLYTGYGYTNLSENPKIYGDSLSTKTYNWGRLKVAENASKYFDMAVVGQRVVIAYYDESVGKLKLKYSSTDVDGSSPNSSITWTESSVVFPDYVGAYVSMVADSHGGIHIAAFDSGDGDLRYLFLPSYSSTDLTDYKVDSAFSVGQWTQIKIHDNKPYIAYYSNTEAGQRSAIKLAYANDKIEYDASKSKWVNKVKTGVDDDGFVTGNWEYMTVPTIDPAQGGTPKFKKVNLGFDTSGTPVLGYLGSNIEFGKWLGE